jgi:16S rRNA C1402 N4-methylase RsmH
VNIAERGFSFLRDGPADMRMDPSVRTILPFTMQAIPTYGVRCSDDSSESLLFDASAGHQHVVNALVIVMELQASLRADEILNKWSELEVGRILREYGEERRWRQLARKIVEARLAGGIQTTSQLVGVIGGSKFSSNSSGKKILYPSIFFLSQSNRCTATREK